MHGSPLCFCLFQRSNEPEVIANLLSKRHVASFCSSPSSSSSHSSSSSCFLLLSSCCGRRGLSGSRIIASTQPLMNTTSQDAQCVDWLIVKPTDIIHAHIIMYYPAVNIMYTSKNESSVTEALLHLMSVHVNVGLKLFK